MIAQQQEAFALELFLLLIGEFVHGAATQRVHAFVHEFDDVEVIINDLSARQRFGHPSAVGIGHVHGDRFDLFGFRSDTPPEGLERIASFAFANEQNRTTA